MRSSSDIVNQIESTGLVAIIRADSGDELMQVVGSLKDGGVTCIEVTMTTPNALEVVRSARTRFGDEAAIGVGTVLDSETARSAILAGAQYIVTPIVDIATIEVCKRYSVAVIAGAMTPTEIVRAWQAGADLVKVFPSSAGWAKLIKDLRGPLPHIKMVPTGGVTLDTAQDFIKAGAAALGAGSALVSNQEVKTKNYGAIQRGASQWLRTIEQARAAR